MPKARVEITFDVRGSAAKVSSFLAWLADGCPEPDEVADVAREGGLLLRRAKVRAVELPRDL